MKPLWDDPEFNPPQEMLVRATFLVCLITLTAGIVLVLVGMVAREPRLLALGIAMLAIAGMTRTWLCRQGRFEDAEAAFNEFAHTELPADARRVAKFVRLLREWEALELQRGSPRFDLWALQAVRHNIRVMVEEEPALEGMLRDRPRTT